MTARKKSLNDYVPPYIKVEEISLESGLASGSGIINPGDETGVVLIDDWTPGQDIQSTEGDSRW